MRIVHSFFSEPAQFTNWVAPGSLFRSFALSCLLAKKNAGNIHLVTDDLGKAILIDFLELPYDSVDLSLNEFSGRYDKEFWALGKLKAYQIQQEPFIHIDGDLFLLKPLPDTVARSRITVQSPEFAHLENDPGVYKIDRMKEMGMVFPNSWDWCLKSSSVRQWAVNMGFYACTDMVINRLYCKEVFDFVNHPQNQEAFKKYPGLWELNVTAEQFSIMAVCRLYGVEVKYLTPVYDKSDWQSLFVHLFWKQKSDRYHDQMISKLLTELAPALPERCNEAADEFKRRKPTTYDNQVKNANLLLRREAKYVEAHSAQHTG